MEILKEGKSILKLQSLFVEDIHFRRKERIEANMELKSNFEKHIDAIDANTFRVELKMKLVAPNEELDLAFTIVGIFSLPEGLSVEIKHEMIQRNAIAIMFPYLRAQLTLITAQPGLTPIVLPPMNINAMFENAQ